VIRNPARAQARLPWPFFPCQQRRDPLLRLTAFFLFVGSGFCGLLYQIVWLRLALASFGIITPVLSVVLSVFMLGLALGSWLGGRLATTLTKKSAGAAAVGYGIAEFGIGLGALVVPWAFDQGEVWLLGLGEASSAGYLGMSAVVITLSILVFTTLMGATFPLMMGFLRATSRGDEETFSYLYLGNVVGAMIGALATALLLIETLGFRNTLLVAAVVNVVIGVVAILMPRFVAGSSDAVQVRTLAPPPVDTRELRSGYRLRLALLFATGFTSMAMEVVWTRAFTPVLKTTIYAFAAVLATYLFATWVGSALYRMHLRSGKAASIQKLLAMLFLAALLPLVINDPRWHDSSVLVLLSLVPISMLLGYMTPQLVDDHARGEPGAAGSAYAVNVVGCILGPLFSGYVLLPIFGVKWALLSMALVYPLFFFGRAAIKADKVVLLSKVAGVAALLVALFSTRTHEDPSVYEHAEVRRDSTASVVAHGEGMDRKLLVNGVGITSLTPLTAIMAHLPLAMREKPPESTCVICFGMGTTWRSLASWGGKFTAVELVPSVCDSFEFFWDDAAAVRAQDGSRIVIDDGRRFLSRTEEKFDLITIDPPPPVEAGGSSLLYSTEFYDVLKERLTPTGVLHQWFPGGELAISEAVVNTLAKSFPHLRVCRSFEPPHVGLHLLASLEPLEIPTIEQAIARMPAAAKKDMTEWCQRFGDKVTLQLGWRLVLAEFKPVEEFLPKDRSIVITDDRPFNEYFWLRRLGGSK